ncbi:MAG TPA: ATP-binding protein [Allosphingosinicella sp.]|nr:ATP-binding protein [Allosphingosinicella sp.]
MTARRLRLPQSILGHTLLLVIGIVVLLTALNLGIILFRPPPRDVPVSAYEVSRLLRGEPIAKDNTAIERSVVDAPPVPAHGSEQDELLKLSLAHQLGLAPADVRVHQTDTRRSRLPNRINQEKRALADYGIERFNPVIFGAFAVAVRMPDGRWLVVSRQGSQTIDSWQVGTALRIVLGLILALVVAWLFAARLARPIRAFVGAVERIGGQAQAEPLEVSGPSEIRLAAEALNDMQSRIRRYVAERTSVVGALAHDLRTPLSRLHFHLAAAPEEIRCKAEAEIREMEQMIAATLEFVENETRSQPREALDLALLVEGVVDDLADLGRDVRLARVEPATVMGDALLLKRLFANLVNNAVTYGRRATVTLDTPNGEAIVEVTDEGPGLSPTDLERAFEPFYRAESSRNRTTGGMGLGLAIVRAAAQRHGGDVMLANRPEGGLSAKVTLPTV